MASLLTVTAWELSFEVGMLAQCLVILKDICQAYQTLRFVTTDIDNRNTEYYSPCMNLWFAYTLNYGVPFWFSDLGKLGGQQDWLEEWSYASVFVWGMTELVRTLQPGKRMLHNWGLQNQNLCEKDGWGWTAHSLLQHKILGSSKSKQAVSKNKKVGSCDRQ